MWASPVLPDPGIPLTAIIRRVSGGVVWSLAGVIVSLAWARPYFGIVVCALIGILQWEYLLQALEGSLFTCSSIVVKVNGIYLADDEWEGWS